MSAPRRISSKASFDSCFVFVSLLCTCIQVFVRAQASWENLFPSPIPATKPIIAQDQHLVYWIQTVPFIGEVFIFNIETKALTWRNSTGAIPPCLSGLGYSSFRRQIYFAGYCTDSREFVTMRFFMDTLSWEQVRSTSRIFPAERHYPLVFLHKNQIHFYGGDIPSTEVRYTDLWRQDPSALDWQRVSVNPGSFVGMPLGEASYYREKIYVYQVSVRDVKIIPELWVLDLQSLTWRQHFIGFAFKNDPVEFELPDHLVFYSKRSDMSQSSMFFTRIIESENRTLNVITEEDFTFQYNRNYPILVPMRESGGVFCVWENQLVLFGGDYIAPSSDIWIYDQKLKKWTWGSVWETPIFRVNTFFSAISNNTLLMFGGQLGRAIYQNINDVWTFDLDSRSWNLIQREHDCPSWNSTCAPLLAYGVRALYNNTLYVLNGQSSVWFKERIFRAFRLDDKVWFKLDIYMEGSHELVTTLPFGLGGSLEGNLLWMAGGDAKGFTEYLDEIIILNLDTLELTVLACPQNAPMLRSGSEVIKQPDRVCIMGGEVPGYLYLDEIWCFYFESKVWRLIVRKFPWVYGERDYIIIYYGTFIILRSDTLTYDSVGAYIYQGERNIWASTILPKPSPRLDPGEIVVLGSSWYFLSSTSREGSTYMVSKFEAGNLFCPSLKNITVDDGVLIEDGSAALDYLPGTNCTWILDGASWVYIETVRLGHGATLALSSLGCPTASHLKYVDDKSKQKIQVTNVNEGMSFSMPSSLLQLSFVVDISAPPAKGFSIYFKKCKYGYIMLAKSCVCPKGNVINELGLCVSSLSFNSTKGNDLPRDDHLSFSAYLASGASIRDKIFLFNGINLPFNTQPQPYHSLGSITVISFLDQDYSITTPSTTGSIPEARYGSCTVPYRDSVLLIGGVAPEAFSKLAYEYNTQQNEWSVLTMQPFGEMEGQLCIISNNLIYLIGGQTMINETKSESFVFDAELKVWVDLPGFNPGPRVSYSAGGMYKQRIYVYSGWTGSFESPSMWYFDTDEKLWYDFGSISTSSCVKRLIEPDYAFLARSKSHYWIHGDELHIFGGQYRNTAFGDVYIISLESLEITYYANNQKPVGSSYQLVAPQPRYGGIFSSMEGKMVVLAGAIDAFETAHDMWWWSPDDRIWTMTSLFSKPIVRRDSGMTSIANDSFVIFGGLTTYDQNMYLNDLWKYNTTTAEWILLSPLSQIPGVPSPRSMPIVISYMETIFVFGGFCPDMLVDGKLWAFDTTSGKWTGRVLSGSGEVDSFILKERSATSLASSHTLWGYSSKPPQPAPSRVNPDLIWMMSLDSIQIVTYEAMSFKPTPRHRAALGYWNDGLWLVGGMSYDNTVLSDIWNFQIDGLKWTKLQHEFSILSPVFGYFVLDSLMLLLAVEVDTMITKNLVISLDTLKIADMGPFSVDKQQEPTFGFNTAMVDGRIWVFGGKGFSKYNPHLRSFTTGFCQDQGVEYINGTLETQILDDGSGSLSYISGPLCSWRILKSNVIWLEYDLSPGDRIIIETEGEDPSQDFTFEGSGIRELHMQTFGFILWFNTSGIKSKGNEGFLLKHTFCPLNSEKSLTGCRCSPTTSLNTFIDSRITKYVCKVNESSQSDGYSRLRVEWIAAISISVSVFMISGVVALFYSKKIKASLRKRQRRLTMLQANDINIESPMASQRLPDVYKGKVRGVVVEIEKLDNRGKGIMDYEDKLLQLSSYRHPNVLLYMGVFPEVDKMYVIFEHMNCGSLLALLARPIKMHLRQKIDIALQIAQGMHFLHNSTPSIVHGSLSSAVILLDFDRHVKIGGLVRSVFGMDQGVDSRLGKIPWCAPEILSGFPATFKSDSYSFAIIMWELYVQQELYAGIGQEMALVSLVVNDHRRPQIPVDCAYEFRLIMEKNWNVEQSRRLEFHQAIGHLKSMKIDDNTDEEDQDRSEKVKPSSPSVFIVLFQIHQEDAFWVQYKRSMIGIMERYWRDIKQIIKGHKTKATYRRHSAMWAMFHDVDSALSFCGAIHTYMEKAPWQNEGRSTIGTDILYCQMAIVCTEIQDHSSEGSSDVFEQLLKDGDQLIEECYGGQTLVSEAVYHNCEQKSNNDQYHFRIHTRGHSHRQFIEVLPSSMQARSLEFQQMDNIKESRTAVSVPYEETSDIVPNPKIQISFEHKEIAALKKEYAKNPTESYFRGFLKSAGKSVIVREVSTSKAKHREALLFKAQIAELKNLSHVNICSVIGGCFTGPPICIILEESRYWTLAQRIQTSELSDISLRSNICNQIIHALRFLHSQSPKMSFNALFSSNIFVDKHHNARLGFFACSIDLSDRHNHDGFLKPSHLAPEILAGGEFSTAGDVYCLGILLYELALLRLAFPPINQETIAQDSSASLQYTFAVHEIPHELLRTLVSCCISHDPQYRPCVDDISINKDMW